MRIKSEKPVSELKPLDVKCGDTRCNEGFHSFTSKVAPKNGKIGDCKDCGDASVDWERIKKKNPADIQYTFDSLKKELLRNVCWVNTLDPAIIKHAMNRGKDAIISRARAIITKKIAKIPTGHFDFLGTPKAGKEIIHYGQHATATCCRKCLERWHGIPQDILLNESQIDYCVSLIERYVDDRLPDLKDEPESNKK